MKRPLICVLVVTAVGLSSCLKPTRGPRIADENHSRYVGVGIYSPGEPWAHVLDAEQAKLGPAARSIDDQAIIVVEDSQTGEVRACGDLTGYCVGMNPWSVPLPPARRTPIALSQHQEPSKTDDTVAAAAGPSAHSKHPHKGRRSS